MLAAEHAGDDDDVLRQHARRAEARVQADAERQREHADRPGQQHPAHDDDHRFGDGAEERHNRLAQIAA